MFSLAYSDNYCIMNSRSYKEYQMRYVILLLLGGMVLPGCGTVSVGVHYNEGPINASVAYHANLSQVKLSNYAASR